MKARLIRKLALSLVALMLFAQASFVLAACQRERGSLASMMMAPATADEHCGDCRGVVSHDDALYANRCFAHCTADLQAIGAPIGLVRSAADVPVLLVQRTPTRPPDTGVGAAPPGGPPHRILLHSFLI
ncbi:MAG TPA: hypothetical protein VE085_06530 [Burkholderiales bacterium]|nr:hypothetical protein [Burkholderiales bacterium]